MKSSALACSRPHTLRAAAAGLCAAAVIGATAATSTTAHAAPKASIAVNSGQAQGNRLATVGVTYTCPATADTVRMTVTATFSWGNVHSQPLFIEPTCDGKEHTENVKLVAKYNTIDKGAKADVTAVLATEKTVLARATKNVTF
ncbi:hypothetical protein [Streptomyces sp. NPDC052496]|uniref:hypothetical protein n=1 Tax=Streptomyces sp. NPDC052496 TaxID=3154951 RepID=UPI00341BAC7D